MFTQNIKIIQENIDLAPVFAALFILMALCMGIVAALIIGFKLKILSVATSAL